MEIWLQLKAQHTNWMPLARALLANLGIRTILSNLDDPFSSAEKLEERPNFITNTCSFGKLPHPLLLLPMFRVITVNRRIVLAVLISWWPS
jgi:hypothetical protein